MYRASGTVSISKKGQPVHQCQLGAISYSLGPAANCSFNAPCTNRPMQCPKCLLVIWSYSMPHHLSDEHSAAEVVPKFAAAISLKFHEKELVAQLLSVKVCKNVCKGGSCECKRTPST